MNVNTEWQRRYGPWAVVTGASNGIGLALAQALAARGLNVAMAARTELKLTQLAESIERDYGVLTRVIKADLSTDQGTEDLLTSTQDLDVGLLVANAGFGTSGDFLDADIAAELNMIDLNVRALAAHTYHYGQRLKARGKGGIILISSILSWQPVVKSANYAATKAYVQSFAEALHIECKPLGIDVLSSAPAGVNTGFAERANMQINGAEPKVVANNTLDALGKQHTVLPHFMSKFLTAALFTAPRFLRKKIMASVMRGMTQ